MKKTFSKAIRAIVLLITGVVFALGSPFQVRAADDNGSLQLNTNILTNNQTGAAGGSEATHHLFSSKLEATIKSQSEKNSKLLSVKPDLTFISQKDNSLRDQKKLRGELFENYSPDEALVSYEKTEAHQVSGFIFVILAGLISAVMAWILGRRFAKRRWQRG